MVKIQYQFKRTRLLRFLSHLDQQRLFQRAFRRAKMQVEYSQGFNPHPKMSFALAMSVGLTSDSEYGEVILSEDLDCHEFTMRMNAVLPEGLEIINSKICDPGVSSLSSSLEKSFYCLKVKPAFGMSIESIESLIRSYLELPQIYIKKRNKKGKLVEKDIHPFIEFISVCHEESKNDEVKLKMILIYIDQQCVKPERILESINNIYGDVFIIDPTIEIHREKLLLKTHF